MSTSHAFCLKNVLATTVIVLAFSAVVLVALIVAAVAAAFLAASTVLNVYSICSSSSSSLLHDFNLFVAHLPGAGLGYPSPLSSHVSPVGSSLKPMCQGMERPKAKPGASTNNNSNNFIFSHGTICTTVRFFLSASISFSD